MGDRRAVCQRSVSCLCRPRQVNIVPTTLLRLQRKTLRKAEGCDVEEEEEEDEDEDEDEEKEK